MATWPGGCASSFKVNLRVVLVNENMLSITFVTHFGHSFQAMIPIKLFDFMTDFHDSSNIRTSALYISKYARKKVLSVEPIIFFFFAPGNSFMGGLTVDDQDHQYLQDTQGSDRSILTVPSRVIAY